MKKLSIVLCITILMLTFSFVAFAEEKPTGGGFAPSLSAPAVFVVPAEKEINSAVTSSEFLSVDYGIFVSIVPKYSLLAYKYLPDIMEQIDIISVAPRE